MNTPDNSPADLEASACAWQSNCEARIAQNPWTAVGIAAAAGFLFRPSLIAALVGLVLRVVKLGIRPFLLFLFVKKALEIAQAAKTPAAAPKAEEPLPPVGI